MSSLRCWVLANGLYFGRFRNMKMYTFLYYGIYVYSKTKVIFWVSPTVLLAQLQIIVLILIGTANICGEQRILC